MTWTVRPRVLLRVINYFPQYSSDPSSQEYDDYYRIWLILYHLFERLTDLLSFDGSDYILYTDAFRVYRWLYTYPDDFYTDPVTDDPDTDSDEGESVYESDDEPLVDFEAFTCRRPGNDLIYSPIDDLGSRDLDYIYNWTLYISRDLTILED